MGEESVVPVSTRDNGATQKKRGITRQEVEEALTQPEQIVYGDQGLIAQVRRGGGLLRVPFLEEGGDRKVLTITGLARLKNIGRRNSDGNAL